MDNVTLIRIIAGVLFVIVLIFLFNDVEPRFAEA